jgi:hypothetical protein
MNFVRENIHSLYPPTTNALSHSSSICLPRTTTSNKMAKNSYWQTNFRKRKIEAKSSPRKPPDVLKCKAFIEGSWNEVRLTDLTTYKTLQIFGLNWTSIKVHHSSSTKYSKHMTWDQHLVEW